MKKNFATARILLRFLVISAAMHMLLFSPLFANFDFAPPVHNPGPVMVDLLNPGMRSLPVLQRQSQEAPVARVKKSVMGTASPETAHPSEAEPTNEMQPRTEQNLPSEAVRVVDEEAEAEADADGKEPLKAEEPVSRPHPRSIPLVQPPLRTAAEFISKQQEKLTYRINLLGMPAGSAVLEAKVDRGEVRISLNARSDSTIAKLYPVDNHMETRHVGGNFIISKIRQNEGGHRRNVGFTIFLRDKHVFWINLLNNRSSKEPIPNSEVLDMLSAFYYLRNRPLSIGTTEKLHVYDGNKYAPVSVEVLRREIVRLANLKEVETLVVRPVQKDGGMFKRTGDVFIWLTDDKNRVPVKVETSIVLGKVTAELVSAESQEVSSPPVPMTATDKDENEAEMGAEG